MTAAAILAGPGSRSSLPSLGHVGVAVGLALSALLPLGSHQTAHGQESSAARIARENLPALATLIVDGDQRRDGGQILTGDSSGGRLLAVRGTVRSKREQRGQRETDEAGAPGR